MGLRYKGSAVFIVVISVLAVFLFPVGAGPFSAVGGPATTFRASRSAYLLRWILTFSWAVVCPILAQIQLLGSILFSHENRRTKASVYGEQVQSSGLLRC